MRWELIKTRGKFKNETKLIIYHYSGADGGQYCAVSYYDGKRVERIKKDGTVSGGYFCSSWN